VWCIVRSDSTLTILSSQSHISGEVAAAEMKAVTKSNTSSGQSSTRQDTNTKTSIHSAVNSRSRKNDALLSWVKGPNVIKAGTSQTTLEDHSNNNVQSSSHSKSNSVVPSGVQKRITQMAEETRLTFAVLPNSSLHTEHGVVSMPIHSSGVGKGGRHVLANGHCKVASPRMGLNDIQNSRAQSQRIDTQCSKVPSPRTDTQCCKTLSMKTDVADSSQFSKSLFSGSGLIDTPYSYKTQSSSRADFSDKHCTKTQSPRVGYTYPQYSRTLSPRTGHTDAHFSGTARYLRHDLTNARCTKTQSKKIGALAALWGGSVQFPVIESVSSSSSRLLSFPKRGSWCKSRRFESTTVGSQYGGWTIGEHFTNFNKRMASDVQQQITTGLHRRSPLASVKPASHSGPGFHT